MVFPFPPLLASLESAVQLPFFPAKLIFGLLVLLSVMVWILIATKILALRTVRQEDEKFDRRLRDSRTTLEVFEEGWPGEGSLHHEIYVAGAREAAFQVLGSREPGPAVNARMKDAGKMSDAQLAALREAFRRGEQAAWERLQSGLVPLRAISIAAIGLGAIALAWTLMRGFASAAGFGALAPWVSSAAFFLLLSALVALPASLGRVLLEAHHRRKRRALEMFRIEVARLFERSFAGEAREVEHPTRDAAFAGAEPAGDVSSSPAMDETELPEAIRMTYRKGSSTGLSREFRSIRDSILREDGDEEFAGETAGSPGSC